jgi:cellulose synthase/poly-beta-1,6-N-acetylglucosamine synthase-like glycosyltransferase
MLTILAYILLVFACLLAIPSLIFFLECTAAIALPRRKPTLIATDNARPRVAVLVPAHNESAAVLPTIEDIKVQLRDGDRLLVVADNCSDDTAAIAAAAGAEVIARNDLSRIGKGYALDFGFRHLSRDPPEVVIVIDADCRLADKTIDHLAITCSKSRRPAQALDLMIAPADSSINLKFGEFAWRVKNWVRPLGLSHLSLPCQLMGTGMAFPWQVIRSADLASGWIVEDLKFGLDLALAGAPPIFCPSAAVTSSFPTSAKSADNQRQRWEHGHIHLILTMAPRFLYLAITRRNLNLLVLTLDMAVPPLALLGLLITALFIAAAVAHFFGLSPAALIVSTISLVLFAATVLACWLKFGRDLLRSKEILTIAPYILNKIRLYCGLLFRGRVSHWIRTDRN